MRVGLQRTWFDSFVFVTSISKTRDSHAWTNTRFATCVMLLQKWLPKSWKPYWEKKTRLKLVFSTGDIWWPNPCTSPLAAQSFEELIVAILTLVPELHGWVLQLGNFDWCFGVWRLRLTLCIHLNSTSNEGFCLFLYCSTYFLCCKAPRPPLSFSNMFYCCLETWSQVGAKIHWGELGRKGLLELQMVPRPKNRVYTSDSIL